MNKYFEALSWRLVFEGMPYYHQRRGDPHVGDHAVAEARVFWLDLGRDFSRQSWLVFQEY